MTLQEMLIEKLKHLSPQEQLQVWKFVSDLPSLPGKEKKSIIGMFEHLGVQINEKDIAEAGLVDPDFQEYCREVGKMARPIEEVRQALAKIPGSLSKFIRTERDAD